MNEDQRSRCRILIHGASATAAAVGGGLAQVPGADAVLIMPIQAGMIMALGDVFGIKMSKSVAMSVTYATLGSLLGRGGAKVLLRWLPGVGNLVNAGVAASITETMGWAIVHQMEAGEFAT